MRFLDKCGDAVRPGDFIVYGHALGRCAGLRYGRVIAIKEGNLDYDKKGPKLHVIGLDDDRSYKKPRLCKKGVLSFSSRVLKVNKSQIPAPALELLETVEVSDGSED